MDPITIANAVGFLIITGYAALKAHNAEKYAKPTGNGFASKVTDSLARIENNLKRVEKRIDRVDNRLDRLEDKP